MFNIIIGESMSKGTILVIQAHPDDADVNIGGTIAKWADEGYDVYYLIVTDGSKGTYNPDMDPKELARIRQEEEKKAAKVLGVKEVFFLGYPDGELILPSLELREKLIRVIRKLQADFVCTLDPWIDYNAHPDHRTVGIVASEATVFAGMPAFNREHLKEGLKPKQVMKIYYFATDRPNLLVDVTEYIDKKLEAILQHKSQIEMFGALAKASGRAKQLGLSGSDYEVGEALIMRNFNELKERIKKGERIYEELRELGVGAGHLAERGFRIFPRPRLV
ncbi:MAG: PIG-L family deacetylase [Thermoprotei archaeon]|nr:MAG: PIG-L family deacetylase [Thermoprotei archaeon]